ncbi:four helix bundle protein [Scytonema hofmannii FACHB-248]|jgi:four helix bundle protein|uniref:Four helix bundle protein n=1 Tax=Scytonema hofmannii FACHB-248 TaxID=1842502 RepID=A0ABR8GPK2_9CYAN|nr:MULTISPECIES: four helix bundle protein [Nostocales]MBD2604881.1 four helix bundle protein [Scytonema hofmannii FACHB-248]
MGDKDFESLEFYKDSLKLLKAAYRLADSLPDYERFNLSDQLRRAACSIVLNIAEGYGRYHYLERLRFLYIARGSLAETKSAFIIAENLGYCTIEQLNWVSQINEHIEKALNGYCRFIRSQQQGVNEYGDHYIREQGIKENSVPNPQSPVPSP